MDQRNPQQKQEVSKASTERLRIRLVATGFDEKAAIALDRGAWIESDAQVLLKPPAEQQEAVGGTDDRAERELKLWEMEFKRQLKNAEKKARHAEEKARWEEEKERQFKKRCG